MVKAMQTLVSPAQTPVSSLQTPVHPAQTDVTAYQTSDITTMLTAIMPLIMLVTVMMIVGRH